jgi:type VI secretion system protein VasI
MADIKKDIATCAAKSSDIERLSCYDELAKSLNVANPHVTTTKGNGNWSVRIEKSPIDDSENVILSVSSDNTIKSGYNIVNPTLIVRCSENVTNVYIAWDLYLGINSTDMTTRFDDEKATTRTWSISTDHKAVFVSTGDVAFAKKMMNHDKLLAQIIPYGESPVMATFSIHGLSEKIKPLRKACKW